MIERLKAMEAKATPGPWEAQILDDDDAILPIFHATTPMTYSRDQALADAFFIDEMRHLAPELIALWEAVQAASSFAYHAPSGRNLTIYVEDSNGALCDALDALNAKAKEGL